MADVFISYSKKDQEEARLLAAYLAAEGYSVWWDTSLLSGENFRKMIMTELGRARVAVVLWTANSINSDWVISEAGRAHAERKLIPIKARGLDYKDIPPPFDNMHTEHVDDREKILAALVSALARPQQELSTVGRLSRIAHYEFLSWFGIIGGAVTLASNFHGAVTLSRWVKAFFQSWADVLQEIWSVLLFFLPYTVSDVDALIFTLISLVALNLFLASSRPNRGEPPVKFSPANVVAVVVPSVIIFAVFLVGLTYLQIWWMLTPVDGLGDGPTIFEVFEEMLLSIRNLLPHAEAKDHFGIKLWYGLAAFFSLCILLAPICAVLYVVGRLLKLRIDPKRLSTRLWRIVIGFALLMALNQLTLIAEARSWIAPPPSSPAATRAMPTPA